MFFDFPEVIKFVHSRLPDRNNLFDNIPKNTLRAWDSRQRSRVSPPSIELQNLNELLKVKLVASSLTLLKVFSLRGGESGQESIMVLDIHFEICHLYSIKE